MALFISSVNTDCLCIDKLLCSLHILYALLKFGMFKDNEKFESSRHERQCSTILQSNAFHFRHPIINFFTTAMETTISQCLKITQKKSHVTTIAIEALRANFLFKEKKSKFEPTPLFLWKILSGFQTLCNICVLFRHDMYFVERKWTEAVIV